MPLSEAARKFLPDPRFGMLATKDADGLPQRMVVWYDLQGHEILMNTRRGRSKDRNLPSIEHVLAYGVDED